MEKRSVTVVDKPPARRETTTMAAAVVNAHERDPHVYVRGMEEAVGTAATDAFPLHKLPTHCYSLDELPLAVRDMERRPEGCLKGWIHYD